MHFFLDVIGTLTDENAKGKWLPLIKLMKENGHSVSVLSGGTYGQIEENDSGVPRSEFTFVLENRNKGSIPDFRALTKSLHANGEDLCLIDNEMMNIFSAAKAGWINSILYQEMEDLKDQLSYQGYIPA